MNTGQLPLAMRWPPQQRFERYVPGENGATVELLRQAAGSSVANWVFVSGAAASGKTHLLIAACAAASDVGRGAQYISLRGIRGDGAATDSSNAIRALGGSALLAIDDVDAIAGDRDAEHAMFDLYNRCKVEKSTLVFAEGLPPAQIGLGLPDLVSRLSSCAQGVLKPLTDGERRDVVRARADARGIALDDSALDWLFTHTQRDLGSLTQLLERIDRASLAAKRRVTVPFLRELVGAEKTNG